MSDKSSAPAGWYPVDAAGSMRWWDGTQWTEHTSRPESPQTTTTPAHSVGPPRVYVTREPVQTSHVFHLLMTLLTCGLWAPLVWLPMVVINSMRRRKIVTKASGA